MAGSVIDIAAGSGVSATVVKPAPTAAARRRTSSGVRVQGIEKTAPMATLTERR